MSKKEIRIGIREKYLVEKLKHLVPKVNWDSFEKLKGDELIQFAGDTALMGAIETLKYARSTIVSISSAMIDMLDPKNDEHETIKNELLSVQATFETVKKVMVDSHTPESEPNENPKTEVDYFDNYTMLPDFTSSNIKAIGYNVLDNTLRAKFGSGIVYEYASVTPDFVWDLDQIISDKGSVGSFFNKEIKVYKHKKLD